MDRNDLVFDLSARKIDEAVADVRQFLKQERGLDVPPNRIREGMADVLYRKFDLLAEDLADMFTSPHREEVRELEKVLLGQPGRLQARESAPIPQTAPAAAVFSGKREFSAGKLAAMMEHILGSGRMIYKTSLNKLLFYSDLTAYYLRGSGISGAVYVNRPYGPVSDSAADILDGLIAEGRVTVAGRTKHFVASGTKQTGLEPGEIKVLDWVLDNYGELGAREISDLSHEERAYRDTKPNEPIAYAYAQFLRRLPPRDLLGG